MIFISAGHHEVKQGASFNGITEYSLTTEWADRIVDILGTQALRVPNGVLREKVEYINSRVGTKDLAIEIHFNSAQVWRDANKNGVVDAGEIKNVGRGSETLYYPSSKKGREAAVTIQSALGSMLQPDRGAKEGWYQMNKAKGADYFLEKTSCTSLIIEPEFIDNLDIINLKMEAACYTIASAILEIIENG